jgi:hypothetical protein
MPIMSPGQAAVTRPDVEEDRPIGEQGGQHTATVLGDDALNGSTTRVRNGTAHRLSRITAATARLAGNVRQPLRSDGARSSRLQPIVDGPFGHVGPAGLEAVVQEVLAELEVDHGGAPAVLLHAEHHELLVSLGLDGVVGEVVAGHGLVLLVEDDGDVGLVGQRARPAQMVEAAMAEPLPL